jgi:hypothetical protein
MRKSWHAHRFFWPIAVTAYVLGNAFDMVGTYINQPHFEHEGNPIYLFLKSHGYTTGWAEAILGKSFCCVLAAVGLRQFIRRRRTYYPPAAVNFGKAVGCFFYGRSHRWYQTFYRLPRLSRLLLGYLAWESLGAPYYVYLGYDNLTGKYSGLPKWDWFYVGSVWVAPYLVLGAIWYAMTLAWLVWDTWRDCREVVKPLIRTPHEFRAT